MSGVFGIIDPAQRVDGGALAKHMAEAMCHHPWFVAESFIDSQANLALGRIGIGVFNRATQPVWNASRTLALVMAGEFYNRAALSENHSALTDEQIALALYEKQGSAFVCRLEGDFIIAIWDETQRRLVLANDRFGIYPTFVAQVDDRFLFAPEIKGVLVDRQVRRALREDAIAEWIQFQRLFGTKTFFDGVTLLPPASILTWTWGQFSYRLDRYWDISRISAELPHRTFEHAVEEGAQRLRAAIAKRMRGSARVGVFLSGGLDGRSILGMIPSDAGAIHTFTFGQPGCRDEHYARQVARAKGAQHHYHPFENGKWILDFVDRHLDLTEGFHPWFHMHGISMVETARQYIDVNLSGLGDLLWIQSNFTPRHLFDAPDDIAFNALFFDLYSQKYTWPGVTYSEERALYNAAFYPRVKDAAFDSFNTELAAYQHLPYPMRVSAFNLHNHFARHLLYAAIFGRGHIEYRFPYCDLDLLGFCQALPFEFSNERRLQKAMIAKTMSAIARVPTTDDELPLTENKWMNAASLVSQKVKRTIHRYIAPIFPAHSTLYADYENWLRTDLRSWAESILLDERTLARGIFRPEALCSLWKRHMAGNELATIGKFAHLITFEMMLRRFYD